jgi:hypothetical protein
MAQRAWAQISGSWSRKLPLACKVVVSNDVRKDVNSSQYAYQPVTTGSP